MARRTKQEAFRAGQENPFIGDIAPLQRAYNVLSGLGAELGGADMGTPVGQRYGERMRQGEEEIRRLQALRAAYPEEFGRGMMLENERLDPYMLDLGLSGVRAARPFTATRFSPAQGEAPVRAIEGPGGMRALPAPPVRELPAAQAAPAAPYYRNVPPEMGTSMRPMTPFQQNQVGLSTGRFGMQGYAPEMAVTDFEHYAPVGSQRTMGGPTPMNKFDQNMMDAYRRGRMGTGASRGMYGEYTPEEMGSAITPYRQGGLRYEAVGPQGGAAGREVGPASGRGMRPTLMEGEFSEVPPQGQIPYGMGYRPNFTMQGGAYTPNAQGMAVSPTGMRFDPRVAAAAAGLGYLEGRRQFPSTPLSGSSALPAAVLQSPVMPSDLVSQVPPSNMYYNFGQGGSGGGRMDEMRNMPASTKATQKSGKGKASASQGAPMPPRRPDEYGSAGWEPNLNYQITEMLDRLTGGNEAERGREYQQYYATNPWPY